MTREEAIKILKAIKVYECYPKSASEETKEAIDMAIEALSAEEAVWNEYDAEFTDLPDIPRYYYEKVVGKMAHEINMLKEQIESAEAEPKWTCTANFIAEQLDRLRNMTDEERWDFLIRFFSPSADTVDGEDGEE